MAINMTYLNLSLLHSSQSDIIWTELGQTTPDSIQTTVTIVTIVSPVKCLEGAQREEWKGVLNEEMVEGVGMKRKWKG